MFKGVIIEESLEEKEILKKISIVSTEVEKVTESFNTPWVEQWTMHTVEIPDDMAEGIAKEVSKSLDREHVWYADFKSDTHHYFVFRDKVFLVDRESKEQYGDVKKYGISLGIPEYQLPVEDWWKGD